MVDLQKIISLSGNIPFDNIKDPEVTIENFCTESIAVVATNKATSIIHGTHSHNSYEFGICYNSIPSTIIESKLYDRKKNALFAVNPMQEHGLVKDINGFSLCGLHIEKSFIQNVSMDIYGSANIVFSNDSFRVNHDLSMLMRLFLEELKYKQSGYEYMAENIGLLIVGNLMRQIKHNMYSEPYIFHDNNESKVIAAIDYMNENYIVGVSCNELADIVKMNKFSFIRSFKSETGKTPYEYLLDLKIEKAKKMLKGNYDSITEISMMCGFSSHSHFTSTFKKKTGMSPTEYKKSFCLKPFNN